MDLIYRHETKGSKTNGRIVTEIFSQETNNLIARIESFDTGYIIKKRKVWLTKKIEPERNISINIAYMANAKDDLLFHGEEMLKQHVEQIKETFKYKLELAQTHIKKAQQYIAEEF